jgi:hypothetical protein
MWLGLSAMLKKQVLLSLLKKMPIPWLGESHEMGIKGGGTESEKR